MRNGVGVYWEKIDDGINVPDDVGGNKWLENNDSNHSYLKLKMPEEQLEKLIDSIMLVDF